MCINKKLPDYIDYKIHKVTKKLVICQFLLFMSNSKTVFKITLIIKDVGAHIGLQHLK